MCAQPDGPAHSCVPHVVCAGSEEQLRGSKGHQGCPAELLAQDDAQAGLLRGSWTILLVILWPQAKCLWGGKVQAPPLLLLVGVF